MLVFHDNMEKIKENQKAFHLCIVVLFIHVIAQEDEDLSSSSLALPQSVYETNKKEKKKHTVRCFHRPCFFYTTLQELC